MSKDNKNAQDRSMFLYTALIFAVALVLIILSFFGQTNLSNLRKNHSDLPEQTQLTQTASPTQTPANIKDDEYAKMANVISSLDQENKKLKEKTEVYDLLTEANAYVQNSDLENAQTSIDKIDSNILTENQKILYNQIITKINEGKEQ